MKEKNGWRYESNPKKNKSSVSFELKQYQKILIKIWKLLKEIEMKEQIIAKEMKRTICNGLNKQWEMKRHQKEKRDKGEKNMVASDRKENKKKRGKS